jgi:hypothetical protein
MVTSNRFLQRLAIRLRRWRPRLLEGKLCPIRMKLYLHEAAQALDR